MSRTFSMKRSCLAPVCALLGLFMVQAALALPPYATGGRAIGAAPGSSPFASSKPYMTLKPYLPASPSKRALPPGANPWAPVPPPTPAAVDAKADFLSKLFAGLGPAAPVWAAPTPVAPAPPTLDDDMQKAQLLAQFVSAVVDEPVTPEPVAAPSFFAPFIPPTPKPTIVPPGFWVPDSPIMPPGAYKAKVATFLGKLFSSLNITMGPPGAAGAKVARRAHQQMYARDLPPSAPASSDPKNVVINSILSEVSQLKSAFVDTIADMVAKQKELIAAAAPIKKPKFLPPWVPTPPPTPDPMEPFQKRIQTLGQVFDMLTALGQDVTSASSAPPSPPSNPSSPPSNPPSPAVNASVLTSRWVRSVPARSVQMAVHQGYQSMPPGTEEVISAGAGRDPESAKEGGGLNLKIKMPE